MKKGKDTRYTLKRLGRDGVVLVFTLFLLLIISILTIAFLYLQFIEVDLIASETKYLQTFYLASAGLEKGKRVMDDQPRWANIFALLQNSPDKTYSDPNWETPITLDSHVSGTYRYRYILDPNTQSSPYKVTIQGIGTINGTERRVEITYNYSSSGGPPPPDVWAFPEFGDLHKTLGYPLMTATGEFKSESGIIATYVNPPQPDLLTNSSAQGDPKLEPYKPAVLTQAQLDAIKNLNAKNKMDTARNVKNSDNRLLFDQSDPLRTNYESQYLESINAYKNSFDYIETRKFENKGTTRQKIIITPTMTVKENRSISLEPGTYIFDSLTMKPGATITTNGNVKIYTTALKLEKGARLMGGSIAKPDPLKLIILAECWTGYPYSSEKNNVNVGAGASVHGHIFAPNQTVYLTRGTSLYGDTRVHGSILAQRIISVLGQTTQTGIIKVVYEGTVITNLEEDAGTWQEVGIQ